MTTPNETYTARYYDGIFGEPHGILPLAEAEPIVNAWINMSVNDIEAATGHRVDSNHLLADLSDDDWKFYEITEDDEEALDIDTVYMLLKAITQSYIEWYKEEE